MLSFCLKVKGKLLFLILHNYNSSPQILFFLQIFCLLKHEECQSKLIDYFLNILELQRKIRRKVEKNWNNFFLTNRIILGF
jgi:hypothetical protein